VYTEPDGARARVRPPLTKRLKLRHWIALDCLAAVPVALAMYVALHRDFNGAAGPPLVAVLALATAVPVALRRLRPLVALTVLLGVSVLVQLTVLDNGSQFPVFPAVAYVLYLVAAVSSRKVAGSALCVSLAILLADALLVPPASASPGHAAIPLALILVVAWAFGSMMRQRRAYATDLQQQAASQAVAEERLRIARELHDVVAHSMSVIAVQAGFGRYVIDDQPAKAREALGAIQATSRDALDEMRRMLSVLRQPEPGAPGSGRGRPSRLRLADLTADPGGRGPEAEGASSPPADGGADAQRPPAAPLRPAPGLGDLDRLLTRVGHAGVHVDLQVSGDRRSVPAGVDLSAFRIVQEALTNVVKHAATPDCRVTLDYGQDDLTIEILDDGRGCALPVGASGAPGSGGAAVPSGHGLIGMGERVHLCGGQFSAGPLPGRGFRVAATLPLDGGPA
jgi:signal transduction histidine kinase